MKVYLISIGVGLLVGLIYGTLKVRSPAPPVIALVGLLGMLVGEQLPGLATSLWKRDSVAKAWLMRHRPHVFGQLPSCHQPVKTETDA